MPAGKGSENQQIATRCGCTRQTVGLWRTRFAEQGLVGLQDAPGRGRPREITDAKIAEMAKGTAGGLPDNILAAALGEPLVGQHALEGQWRRSPHDLDRCAEALLQDPGDRGRWLQLAESFVGGRAPLHPPFK